MLPSTARPKDIVEVINEDHDYYGLYGKLVSKSEDRAVVRFYKGRDIEIERKDLKMKARVGTSRYKELKQRIEEYQTNLLTWEDLNEIMNHAIDVGDYKWAYEIKQRRDSL